MEYLRLSDCSNFASDRTSNITFENYISTENMIPNKGGVTIASSLPDVKTTSAYKPNDILLSNIRPYFCKIWLADKEGSCSNDVLVVRAKEKINPKFLYYVLSDNNFFNWDNATSKGTKMPRGTPNAIMKYFVPDVGESVQQKIANILSRYDEAIENNSKRIKLLEQMAQNLYKEWFVRFRFPGWQNAEFENGMPKGWKVVRLRDIAKDVGKSITKDEIDYTNDVYIPIDCIPNHQMALTEVSDIENAESSLQKFSKNDILFGAMRVYFHKVILAPMNGVTRTTCFVINSKDKIVHNYLYSLLFNESTINYANTISVGATMPYVRWNDFMKMYCLLPSNDIIEKYNNIIEPIFTRILSSYKLNQNLAKQRDLLLPRLMSGKLEV